MILAELRRVLQISESRGDEIAQEVIKGMCLVDVTSFLTLFARIEVT